MAIKEGPAEHVHLQHAHTQTHTDRKWPLKIRAVVFKEEQPKTFPLVGALQCLCLCSLPNVSSCALSHVAFFLLCRVAVHPAAGGAAGPPGAHAGAEGPGDVRAHPHQHAVPHQEGGKQHGGQ